MFCYRISRPWIKHNLAKRVFGSFYACRQSRFPSLLFLLATPLVGTLPLGSATSYAEDYTPQHPYVQEMVKRGTTYLNSIPQTEAQRVTMGTDILVALALYKGDETSTPETPRVKRGIDASIEISNRLVSSQFRWTNDSMYTVSVAGMLLASIDPAAYEGQIRTIRDTLLRNQRPNGGFGYMMESSQMSTGQGDISQTQYVAMCLWTFSQVGFESPEANLVRCLKFLEAAQHNNGGWAYQHPFNAGNDPNGEGLVTASRTSAGFSAYLIFSDTLGLFRSKQMASTDEEGLAPAAFRRVDHLKKKTPPDVDLNKIESTIKRCEAYYAANPYQRASYHYYYTYSKERFESFLELSKGKTQKSPAWYNDGVEKLAEQQNDNGSWGTKPGDVESELNPEVCTSFAILYLIRSTQRSIGQLHDDTLLGGHGLPDDPTSVVVKNGRVLNKTVATSIDDALKLLEDDSQLDGKDRLIPDQLVLPTDRKQRREQLARFSRLMSSKDVKTRRFAAKLLGRGDDLEFAPALIYGISDPDATVARTSEASLRLISRKLQTYHLPKEGDISLSDRTNAIVKWQQWYKTIRPDHIFAD